MGQQASLGDVQTLECLEDEQVQFIHDLCVDNAATHLGRNGVGRVKSVVREEFAQMAGRQKKSHEIAVHQLVNDQATKLQPGDQAVLVAKLIGQCRLPKCCVERKFFHGLVPILKSTEGGSRRVIPRFVLVANPMTEPALGCTPCLVWCPTDGVAPCVFIFQALFHVSAVAGFEVSTLDVIKHIFKDILQTLFVLLVFCQHALLLIIR